MVWGRDDAREWGRVTGLKGRTRTRGTEKGAEERKTEKREGRVSEGEMGGPDIVGWTGRNKVDEPVVYRGSRIYRIHSTPMQTTRSHGLRVYQ